MPEQDPKIKELEDRLDRLVRTQIDFQKEISAIRGELVRLRAQGRTEEEARTSRSFYVPPERAAPERGPRPPVRETPTPSQPAIQPPRRSQPISSTPSGEQPPVGQSEVGPGYVLPKQTAYEPGPVLSSATVAGDAFSRFASQYTENARANLEEFIGKNLISLIGIVVLILGVGIGAKYAIDNNLISPLTRIVIGYIFGFGLIGLAIKLKPKYHNFSSVLISGGMAIMYFVTYFAYALYALISQLSAFGLMVVFTGFTVAAALVYSRQVIAHIGLVGAYAVPFLLSSDTGNFLALFSYMAVINVGILAVSLKKRWTPIFYTSSFFTWAIFWGWFITKYAPQQHFGLALIFLAVFFTILYGMKVAQTALLKDEDDRTESLVSSAVTAGIFYAMCYAIVVKTPLEPVQYWTFFTYLAIASIGIIATSLRFYRHIFVVHAPSALTWTIFLGWFVNAYSHQEYFELALVFMGVFFAISYGVAVAGTRLFEAESDRTGNLVASVLAGVILYSFCFAMIADPEVGTSHYWTLFAYVAVASMVLLATSFKFFGRVFMYLVVPFTWAIYAAWFVTRYDATHHFDLAVVFLSLFFAIFYLSILFHRLVEDSFTLVEHTTLVLSNAFVFYGLGYSLLDGREELRDYLGLYTAANAVLHLGVALVVRRLKPKAVDAVQVLTILVLTFASIAIPVQFDGNVVTMVWVVEAAVLFWFGRSRDVRLFERYSYPVMLLAAGSLGLEWIMVYADPNAVTPFANSDFITAIVFVAAFAFIHVTNRDPQYPAAIDTDLVRPFGILIAAVGCIVLFNMFRMEIGNYFYLASVKMRDTNLAMPRGPVGDLLNFNVIWQLNYALFFLTAMAVVNLKKFRSTTLAVVNSTLAVVALAVFTTAGMFLFSELRTTFMSGEFYPAFVSAWMYIGIRPISYAIVGGLVYQLYEYSRDPLMQDRVDVSAVRYGFDALAYTLVFIVASCELVNLMGQFGIPDATKLGLSILWGMYALILVMIGIARDKKHLRIAAIALLAVTLAKLFFYDIADLDTIPKTILFVTLGITLLVVSFLYNKYKGIMFKADAVEEE